MDMVLVAAILVVLFIGFAVWIICRQRTDKGDFYESENGGQGWGDYGDGR